MFASHDADFERQPYHGQGRAEFECNADSRMLTHSLLFHVQSISSLTKLRHLELYCSKVVNFGALSALANLKILQLGYHLSDASLATIATLPTLRELCLTAHVGTQTDLSENGLRALMVLPTLTHLTLICIEVITDANVHVLTLTGLPDVHKFKSLETFLNSHECPLGRTCLQMSSGPGRTKRQK